MLTVHHLCKSQSERIVWLCEELEIPYQLERYDRDPITQMAPPAYKALHPVGSAPIITDGELVLPESGAIIEYIIRKYGQDRLSVPPQNPGFADYVFWFHYANGSLMPKIMMSLVVSRICAGGDNPSFVQATTGRANSAFALVEKRLGEAPFFAGREFTAADIIMLFPLTTMRNFAPIDISGYPNLCAYLQRIGARPAYRRAMAKADPDMPPMLD